MAELLGDRIRKVRERYGMPASVLAKRVGLSRQHLYMIETSETENPGALTVLAIAEALGVSTDYLLKGTRKTRRLTEDIETGETVGTF
jgi:transcriptional regulator with XRE-family HTH domain